MKVTVARGGRLAGEQDPVMQQDVLEQELVNQGQNENLPLFVKFGEILRQQIPANFLATLTIQQVVENLRLAGQFVMCRKDDVKVSLQPLQQPGHYYLFANSLDANHIFSSIQEFLNRRSLHFRVICHPILSTERTNGILSRVEEGNSELQKESFLWLELEQFPKRLVEELELGVQRIVTAALKVSHYRQKTLQRISDLSKHDNLHKFNDLFQWLQEDNLYLCEQL